MCIRTFLQRERLDRISYRRERILNVVVGVDHVEERFRVLAFLTRLVSGVEPEGRRMDDVSTFFDDRHQVVPFDAFTCG